MTDQGPPTRAEFDRLGVLVRRLQSRVPKGVGEFDAEWPGSATSVDISIPHGLDHVPTTAFAMVQDSTVSGDQTAEILEMDDTAIGVRITTTGTTPTLGDISPVGWVAW